MGAGDTWNEFLPLDTQLEIWFGDHLYRRLTIWEILFDRCAVEMMRPMGLLEQLNLWESKFPLKLTLK